jgi:hypothetical protein
VAYSAVNVGQFGQGANAGVSYNNSFSLFNFDTSVSAGPGVSGDTTFGYYGEDGTLAVKGSGSIDYGYFATSGSVNANYTANLTQGYAEPTPGANYATFNPGNTFVRYANPAFTTQSPGFGANVSLDTNFSGSVSGEFGTGLAGLIPGVPYVVSGSKSIPSFGTPVDLWAFNHNGDGKLKVLGLDIGTNLAQGTLLELPFELGELQFSAVLGGATTNSTFKVDVNYVPNGADGTPDTGNKIFIGNLIVNLLPQIELSSTNSGGTAQATGATDLVSINFDVPGILKCLAPEAAPFLPFLGKNTFTLIDNVLKLELQVLDFTFGPAIEFQQTASLTPTSRLTYAFSNPDGTNASPDVWRDGTDLGAQHTVTFVPGQDTLRVGATGSTIVVHPTLSGDATFNNELDQDLAGQYTLTVGKAKFTLIVAGLNAELPIGPIYGGSPVDFGTTVLGKSTWNVDLGATVTQLTPFTIDVPTTTGIGLTRGTNPSTYGDPLTFTATVGSDNGATPTGAVEFHDGNIDLGPGTALTAGAVAGTATSSFTISSLSATTHSIWASYSPTGWFESSQSGMLSQAVNPAPIAVTTNTSVMLAGNPVPPLSGVAGPGSFVGSTTFVTAQGDTITVTLGTTATSGSPAGTYQIFGTLSGVHAFDYVIRPANYGTMHVVNVGADPTSSGPKPITYWDNKDNRAQITAADLQALGGLHLIGDNGQRFVPHTVAELQSWLKKADTHDNPSASNPAYQLSAQLAVLELNVLSGDVGPGELVYAGQLLPFASSLGLTSLTAGGFISVGNLLTAANALLALPNPNPAAESAFASALQAVNMDSSFVVGSQAVLLDALYAQGKLS